MSKCAVVCICVSTLFVCCSGGMPGTNCHLCEFPSHMGFGVARWLGQRVQVKKSCSESQRLIGSESVWAICSICLSVCNRHPRPLCPAAEEKRSRQCRWSYELDLHCSIIDLKLWPFSLGTQNWLGGDAQAQWLALSRNLRYNFLLLETM